MFLVYTCELRSKIFITFKLSHIAIKTLNNLYAWWFNTSVIEILFDSVFDALHDVLCHSSHSRSSYEINGLALCDHDQIIIESEVEKGLSWHRCWLALYLPHSSVFFLLLPHTFAVKHKGYGKWTVFRNQTYLEERNQMNCSFYFGQCALVYLHNFCGFFFRGLEKITRINSFHAAYRHQVIRQSTI